MADRGLIFAVLWCGCNSGGLGGLPGLDARGDAAREDLPLPVDDLGAAGDDLATREGLALQFGVRASGASAPFRAVGVGDFDQDGRQDVTIVGYDNAVHVFLLDRLYQYKEEIAVNLGDEIAAGIEVGDLNGDEKLDIVTSTRLSRLAHILLGEGGGRFEHLSIKLSFAPTSLVAGDFDGEGRRDLIVAGEMEQEIGMVEVIANQGGGIFASKGTLQGGKNPIAVSYGDMDGDGRLDIVVADIRVEKLWAWLNEGAFAFNGAIGTTLSGPPNSVTIARLGARGKLGAVIPIGQDGVVLLADGDGAGGFRTVGSYPVKAYPAAAAMADFNQDSLLDVATVGPFSNSVFVFLGRPDGSLAKPMEIPLLTEGEPEAVVAKDMNADGKPDIVVAITASGQVLICENESK